MLREIAARLGVQVESGELVSFMGALDQAKGALAGFGALLAGGMALGWIKDQISAAGAIKRTAAGLGVATDELQRLQYAFGGDAETSGRAMFTLSRTIGKAAEAGGEGAAAFTDLGIKIKDSQGNVRGMSALLPEIADRVANAGSAAEGAAIATKFFGRQAIDVLPTLKKGGKGIRDLGIEFDELGGGISAGSIDALSKAGKEMKRFNAAQAGISAELAAAFVPAIVTVFHWVTKLISGFRYLTTHTRIVQQAAVALGIIATAKMIPSLVGMYRSVMALRMGMFGLSMPVWLVIAGIAALYLIFDDLWSLMHGEGSVIGDLVESMGGVGAKTKLIEGLQIAWSAVTTTITAVGKALSGVWDSMVAFAKDPSTKDAVIAIGDAIESAWKSMVKLVKEVADFLQQASAPKSSTWGDLSDALHDDIADFTGSTDKKRLGGNAATPFEYAINAAQLQAQGGARGATPANVTQTNSNDMKVEVNIATTGTIDPKDQTKATREGLKEASDKLYLAAYNAVTRGDAAPAGGLPK